MNKHTKYLKENWQTLGAVQWLWFERKGPGILYLEPQNVLCLQERKISFGFYDDLDKKLQKVCKKYPAHTYIIVHFDDGAIITFKPPKSPPECFKMMKPQLNDFIADTSKGIEID